MLNNGLQKQFTIEGILRKKIYNSYYWKRECYALNSVTFIEKAITINYIGGAYGRLGKPCEFICLLLKLIQMLPEIEVALEYLNNEDYKYLTALSAFYIRLIAKPKDVYFYLEPLLSDYRKLIIRDNEGKFNTTTVDQFIYDLLTKEIVCNVTLPKVTKRIVLEENEKLGKYKSILSSINLNEELSEDNKNISNIRDNSSIHNKTENTVNTNIDINNKLKDFEINIYDLLKFNGYNLEYEDSSDSENELILDNDKIDYTKFFEKLNDKSSFNKDNFKVKFNNEDNKDNESNVKEENKVVAEDTVEYWNNIRLKLGLPLLPTE